jgi:hypothetical protein
VGAPFLTSMEIHPLSESLAPALIVNKQESFTCPFTPLQSKIHSFAKYFFPAKFKRKIWREKIYSSKE